MAGPQAAQAHAPAAAAIPWWGIVAVLLGTFISTMNARFSSLGLADIRGAMHAGFDEGAWITTAQTAAQMVVAPLAIYLSTVRGARACLIESAMAFGIVSFLEPFSPNLPTLLALQGVAGLASGFFVPLTLGFILRNTPPRVWAYGVALYALNLEVSLNVSASIEGWYLDNLSWRMIFWQNVPLAFGMAACLSYGVKPETMPTDRPRPDWYGIASGGLGLGLIFAALDQGNRLDWSASPVVWALMLAGVVFLTGFYFEETRSPHPAIRLQAVLVAPMPRILILMGFLRTTLLATSFVIPQFLQAVRGFRTLEVGQTLIWIALPQLALCLLAGYSMRRMDPRFVASVGFVCIAIACLSVAHGLTPLWGSDQFLPSALLQAVGQSFALSGCVFFAILHLDPKDVLTFGAAMQTARLLGGEIGQAFITTFTRVREQVASNLLGQHVTSGDPAVLARIAGYAHATAAAGDQAGPARGVALLANAVRAAATTQSIIDTLIVVAAATAVTVIIVVTRRAAPEGPASHIPLFPRREP